MFSSINQFFIVKNMKILQIKAIFIQQKKYIQADQQFNFLAIFQDKILIIQQVIQYYIFGRLIESCKVKYTFRYQCLPKYIKFDWPILELIQFRSYKAPKHSDNFNKELMTKKIKRNNKKIVKDINSFTIAKGKSFINNLNAFLKMLQQHHQHLSSRQFIAKVHNFIDKYRQSVKSRDVAVGTARQKIKICKACDGWCGNKVMMQCVLCQDFYHEKCLKQGKQNFEQSGLCENCNTEKLQKFDKNAYLTELIEDHCSKCDKERKDKEAFVHCMHCSQRFHKQCYGKNIAVCADCKLQIDQQLKKKSPVRQPTLFEYRRSITKKQYDDNFDQRDSEDKTVQISKISFKNYKYDEEKTQPYRQKDLFSYSYPIMSEQQIQKYKQGLLFAILAKNMKYTQSLKPLQCSLDINTQESLDFGLDHMTKSQYQVYRRYKMQPIGPFRFVFTEGMGYNVVADKQIKEKTLICEYVGDVVTLRKCIQLESENKNDSLMELRVGYNSQQTLIIRPQNNTNMARFINGINNSKGSSKANVATVRKLAKGCPTVILYSIRNIKRGESLLYDYNAGNTNCQYDTSNFI